MTEDVGDAQDTSAAGSAGASSSPLREGDEAIKQARAALRSLLSSLHVLDALPERSRMLAVDAELPFHTVLTAVFSEQHPRPHCSFPQQGLQGAGGPGAAALGAPQTDAPQPGSGAGQMRREGQAAPAEPPPALSCGVVSPSLPSNVLAEVCEFDSSGNRRLAAQAEPAPPEDGADERSPTRRRWTSPDDGWGMNLPMQDLEKMPMGMPVTVGELADFLADACASKPPEASQKDGAEHEPQRWAEPVGGTSPAKPLEDGRCTAEGGKDMLDWTVAEWRAHRLKMSGHKEEPEPSADENDVSSASRLFVEERPEHCGPVLVHRVPLAPPRPILCTDDPEATLMKAVELLLTYPELDALPIVSPVRCTVVAHLTLSYCLAYMMGRMRGNDLLALANLMVSAQDAADSGTPAQRVFDSSSLPEPERNGECWAERRVPAVDQPPWVLRRSQPVRELLLFFARTHHSGVPVVEDGGGVVGLLSRRDLLHFLDLAMQSARRCSDLGVESVAETDRVGFDTTAPIEGMLETLQRCRTTTADEGASATALPGGPPAATSAKGSGFVGASLIYEQQLTLKALLLRLLNAENRKLLFVQDTGNGSPPRLLRVLSVGDVWHLLIGDSQELERLRRMQAVCDTSGESPPECTGDAAADSIQVSDA
uniref:CBS domain-containing protein n=1 Tax=Alexandrium andersonii TaxID=327968 RepID=A0A7S2MZV3_9DINO|mmetsp:Transcript_80039/g.179102  ORF Transcript_80039/g.179102 Transcript_80039/m.179102 type:complete len:653 (+) Transcript_80039:157-2115(+)